MLKDEERYGRLAARVLAKRLPDNPGGHPGIAHNGHAGERPGIPRDKLISSVVLAIEAKVRRRRIVVGGVVLAVAASALLTVRFALRPNLAAPIDATAMAPMLQDLAGRDNLLFRGGAQQSISGPMALAIGDRVHLADYGSSTLAFADGTNVDLGGGSDIQLSELGARRRILLDHGRLDLRVAKLGAGKRFLISTRDSEVEVHGTVFTVEAGQPSPACAAAPVSTRIRVSEGVVSVRNRGEMVYLHPGDVWPCSEVALAPSATEKEIPDASAGRAVSRPLRVAIRPSRPPLAPEDRASSSLAEQNNLFAEAMAAERKKQRDLALRKLDELLRKFPGGPLDESARAERNKILPGLR
jgi:hypothetical protein